MDLEFCANKLAFDVQAKVRDRLVQEKIESTLVSCFTTQQTMGRKHFATSWIQTSNLSQRILVSLES